MEILKNYLNPPLTRIPKCLNEISKLNSIDLRQPVVKKYLIQNYIVIVEIKRIFYGQGVKDMLIFVLKNV